MSYVFQDIIKSQFNSQTSLKGKIDVFINDNGEVRVIKPESIGNVKKLFFDHWSQGNEATKNLIKELSQHVKFRNVDDIERYLYDNPSITAELEEHLGITKNYFPNDELIIELFHDPMENDDELVIYAQTDLLPKEALSKIRQLNKERRSKNLSSSIIMVDVEFK